MEVEGVLWEGGGGGEKDSSLQRNSPSQNKELK